MKKQSLEKLISILEQEQRYKTDMFFRNAFATACILSIQGDEQAAQKTLSSLFDWLGWDGRKKYFVDIKHSLGEYAFEYAKEISANAEINKLLYKNTVENI